MSLSVNDVRKGLKGALGSISELRLFDYVPSTISAPCAVIGYPNVYEYDKSFGRGLDRMEIEVTVFLGSVAERSSQDRMDAYISGSGGRSIKVAVEADRTLDGACADIRVVEAKNYGPIQSENVTYLGATFLCEVFG